MKKIFNIAVIAAVVLSLTGCEEFLNRPTIDNPSTGMFYQNDEQVEMGVNYLYNSPWYDFTRGFFSLETLAGNMYDNNQYLNFTLNGTSDYEVNMSKSLWAVVGHCSTVADNIAASNGPSKEAKERCIGEALTMRALAYFFLVRAYGELPIIHNNAEVMNEGNYATMKRNTLENVYDYVLYQLETAEQLLKDKPVKAGRVNYWSARALEAKVYLTMAGVSGTLNNEYLEKAAEISNEVIEKSGYDLMPNYEDIFRMQNNFNQEALISWHWDGKVSQWTAQNSFQNDLALEQLGQWGDNWGHWKGASVDLQEAFGVTALMDPSTRAAVDKDARRHGTYMLPGDFYTYFWTDWGGFDPLKNCYDDEYCRYGAGGKAPGSWGCATGSHVSVKHCYGNNYDHKEALGYEPPRNMSSGLSTHILRMADIFLINAEACILANSTKQGCTKADGLKRLNRVRARSIEGYTDAGNYTWEDVWKERRLELAMEGDRWFDFVRVSYYNLDFVVNELKYQHRFTYWGQEDTFKKYLENGTWDLGLEEDGVTPKFRYPSPSENPYPEAYQNGLGKKSFYIPFTQDDVIFNGNLASTEESESIDVRGKFNFDKYTKL